MIPKKSYSFFKKGHIKFASCLMLAGTLLGGLALSHNTYAEETVPDVGTEWINVKLPLSMGYYSTADSHHKTITSRQYKVENLSSHPVDVKLTGFVGGDGASPADTRGVEELKLNVSDKQFSRLVFHGKRISYDKNNQTSLYTLGAAGNGNGSTGIFNFSGTTASDVDLSKPILLQNQLNFTLTGLEQDGSIPQDKSSLQIKNVTIESGNSWEPSLNFVGGTNEYGEKLTFNQVTVLGAEKVNTNEPGQYEVIYTYRNVSEKATVTVSEKNAPKLKGDGSIDFANESWSVIKGPDQMGEGNYLIIANEKIGHSRFTYGNRVEGGNIGNNHWIPYFSENQAYSNGYAESLVKETIDKWYNENIKGTNLENYVQPVYINTPTLEEMNWPSNLDAKGFLKERLQQWYDITEPDSIYATKVSQTKGEKQAFVLSGADVSVKSEIPTGIKASDTVDTISIGNKLTDNAEKFVRANLGYTDILRITTKGMWLREPGAAYYLASAIVPYFYRNHVSYANAGKYELGVYPAIVVHID
ncbi:bacterial Ig-like domain-containing protein [Lactococcus petauri]|uniref:bacterial Ig-like domain-containing protein n=1 Tax=Lactococcus petauri TaxID=1940789 RepID=UPI001F585278|nr:bacterial Ig-like domain-containing protein [Lactococcus petauri]